MVEAIQNDMAQLGVHYDEWFRERSLFEDNLPEPEARTSTSPR